MQMPQQSHVDTPNTNLTSANDSTATTPDSAQWSHQDTHPEAAFYDHEESHLILGYN
ncbi:hypothetical protein AB0I53_16940 [Saccharopolyspora sp. NPDC050389]|uniref:hypothetical protein n=1 Tax=Saccharopolyspora sp. NPDC050389 TaxID=3155516 RepID=UPI0033E98881